MATRGKRKVTEFIANCEILIQYHVTRINLNVFPLGSYDIIIGMEWLEKYKVLLNFIGKTFTYATEDKIVRKVNSFNKPVSLMEISTLQLRRFLRKGCNLYVVKVVDLLLNENPKLVRDHPVLNEFMDLFRE